MVGIILTLWVPRTRAQRKNTIWPLVRWLIIEKTTNSAQLDTFKVEFQ